MMKSLCAFILVVFFVGSVLCANPLPNVGYIGYGYNVFHGNPQATDSFDPGFGQAPLFAVTYTQQKTTPDGQWLVPDGTSVPGSATTCSTNTNTSTVSSGSSYQHSLEHGAKFNIGGFNASFSAGFDFKRVYDWTNLQSNTLTTVVATCETYVIDVNPFVHPVLADDFVDQIDNIPTVFSASNATFFWELFDYIGTHFATQIVFGSRYAYTFRSTSEQYAMLKSSGMDISFAASITAKIQAGISITDSHEISMSKNFTSQTSDTLVWGEGIAPPANGDDANWLAQALTSTQMDPLEYTLVDISQLFTSEYTNNPALLERHDAVAKALSMYCSLHLIPTGALASCDSPK
eukprot:TRINITY_DN1042_c0_g1_i1.p1 TRINITY_DN1042_c0_g1~~TRINITY_DN1042_c0_g1_i1.p1  ORF type:complete len:359 (-),score=88.85 TRINITY_DN1042_c0_g1_i1:109-1152(-)